jgi:Four helix bundle sensory module for signal transduction
MRFFRDLPIGRKLYGLAGVLIGFLVLVGVLGLTNLASSASRSKDMYQNATLPIAQLDNARSQLGNVDADLVKAVTQTSGASQDLSAVQTDAGAYEQALIKTYASSALSPAEQAVYGPAQTAWSQLKDVAATIGKDVQAGGVPAGREQALLFVGRSAQQSDRPRPRPARDAQRNAGRS